MELIKRIVHGFFARFGISVLSQASMMPLQRLSVLGLHKILWILRLSPHASSFSEPLKVKILSEFRSQLGQDVFALSLLGPNEKGFFVEFGATNGVELSNTYLLETHFGWTGILCEPASGWQSELTRNRTAIIDSRCVFSESKLKLEFLESTNPSLSTLSGFGEDDEHMATRQANRSYEVETVSLLDLLVEHNAPSHIDFLSVDTEGSEFEILEAFDFSKYTFGAICVEHNFTFKRKKIKKLLFEHGYRQVHHELSDFDDWFVFGTNQSTL